MDSPTQHGYLVLADISGYTSYLAGTELDHAHEILTALLETIVERFRTVLTIAKLEGDAVFAYSPAARIPRGETLLELVECTYLAFRDHVEAAHRRTTCQCNACRNIPSLDLKFLVHHGDYIVQNISGIHELVGSDVNLVHRLLKNHVAEATGWKAYALFTDPGLAHIDLPSEGMHAQPEAYEHLGEMRTFSLDLHQRYRELTEARRVVVAAEEADFTVSHDFPVPPPRLWDWINDPVRRVQWSPFDEFKWFKQGGRTAAGARSHCVHGRKAINAETVLDWRPFDYFTLSTSSGPTLQTSLFEPINNGQGTRLTMRTRLQMPLPAFLRRPLMAQAMGEMPWAQMFAGLTALMQEEEAALSNPTPAAQ